MKASGRSLGTWRTGITLIAAVAIAAAAWTAGRSGFPTRTTQALAASTGFDLGVAGKPAPTGTLREFQLVAKEVPWEIAPGVIVPAMGYNGQVPGPLIRVTAGDTVRVTLKNELDQATAIHWHGMHVPNAMDGVPPVTQPAIEPGQSFTYEFPASHAGTFMYHAHLNTVEQIDRGLYAPLIIDPAKSAPAHFDKEFTMTLSAWNTSAIAAGSHAMADGDSMPGCEAGMGSMNYSYFTINGKAFPANPTWNVATGDLVRVRIINISNLAHPMHLHGYDVTVVAKDGEPIRPELQQTMNTLSVDAGETYNIVFRADNSGTWVFHCHELHHTENDGVEPGGLIQAIQVGNATTSEPAPAVTPMPAEMPGMQH